MFPIARATYASFSPTVATQCSAAAAASSPSLRAMIYPAR
jgi:hypothetical protein